MSVSITEVLASEGYKPAESPADAEWLVSQRANLAELMEQAEYVIDRRDQLDELDRLRDGIHEAGGPDEEAEAVNVYKLQTNFYYKYFMKGEIENARRN